MHCAEFVSEADAIQSLRDYAAASIGQELAADLPVRTLNFRPGFRPTPWIKNCVAVGLSAGFIEPLEASALAMIEQATASLVESFPADRDLMGPCSRAFNSKMQMHWASIQEFLKLTTCSVPGMIQPIKALAVTAVSVRRSVINWHCICRAPNIWIPPELMNCSPLPVINTFGWG